MTILTLSANLSLSISTGSCPQLPALLVVHEIRKHHCSAVCAFEGACKPQAQLLEAADYSGCFHLFTISFSHHLRQTQKETKVIMGKVPLEKQEHHTKSARMGYAERFVIPLGLRNKTSTG